MKRLGNCYNKICSIENVEAAFNAVVKNKRHKSWLLTNKDSIINSVHHNLLNSTYDLRGYKKMEVREPKLRIIHYPKSTKTCVYHKCLINVIGSYLISKLPNDSYASIKGRGLHKAVDKLREFLKDHKDWYFFQGDIKKYFQNIDHDILKRKLRTVLKCKRTLDLCDTIIDSFSEGLPIGNHPSPLFANLFLSKIGHKIKEVLNVKFLIIYMDDIIAIFKSKKEAENFRDFINFELNNIKLTLKPNYKILKVKCGINALGYVFYGTHTRLRTRIKLRMFKSIRKYKDCDDKTFKRKLASYYGWCIHADCRGLLRKAFGDRLQLFEKPNK